MVILCATEVKKLCKLSLAEFKVINFFDKIKFYSVIYTYYISKCHTLPSCYCMLLTSSVYSSVDTSLVLIVIFDLNESITTLS